MTVQELCDELTILSYQHGLAQATVKHISGELVKSVNGVEPIGDDIVMITSEEIKPNFKKRFK